MAKSGSSQDVLELLRGLSSTGQTISEQRRLLDEQHQKMIERAIQQAQFQAGMTQKEKELAQEKELFGEKEKGETNRLNISEKAARNRQLMSAKGQILEVLSRDPDFRKLPGPKQTELIDSMAGVLFSDKAYPVTPGMGGEFQIEQHRTPMEFLKEAGKTIVQHPGKTLGSGLGGAGAGLLASPWTGPLGPVVGGLAGLSGAITGLEKPLPSSRLGIKPGEFSAEAEKVLNDITDKMNNKGKTVEEVKPDVITAFQNGSLKAPEALKINDFLDRMSQGETTPREAPTNVITAAKAQIQKGSTLDQAKPPISPDWVQVPKPYVSSTAGMTLAERIGGLASAWDDDQANAMAREIFKVPDSSDRERLTNYLGALKINKKVFSVIPTQTPTPTP